MKRILFILILASAWQLSHSQERYYIVSEDWAKTHKQYRITNWYGIDPVQLKSGEWVVSEKCYYEMTTKFIDRKISVQKANSVRIELEKYPARVVRKDEWKEAEMVEEKTIPK